MAIMSLGSGRTEVEYFSYGGWVKLGESITDNGSLSEFLIPWGISVSAASSLRFPNSPKLKFRTTSKEKPVKTRAFDAIVQLYHRHIAMVVGTIIKKGTLNEDGSITIPAGSFDGFTTDPQDEIGAVSKAVMMTYGGFAKEMIDMIVSIRTDHGHYRRGDSEWIQWKGNECPVRPGTIVDVILKSGDITRAEGITLDWRTTQGDSGLQEFQIDQYMIIKRGEQ